MKQETKSIINYSKGTSFVINMIVCTFIVLTLFFHKGFVLLVFPFAFLLGAMYRGENKLKGFKEVRETGRLVK